jgi:CRP-like cAMP-binding protein
MGNQSIGKVERASAAPDPRQNRVLAALPIVDYARLRPNMEFAPLLPGRVVCASGARSGHVYFPTDGIISMRYVATDESSAEIATTGREGLVGTAIFLGGQATGFHAVVQIAGWAYRIDAGVFNREFGRGGALQTLALRHTLALIAQVGQVAACNRLHSTEQQLCRAILWSLDRLDADAMAMTHQSIASNLGVRRECVTRSAGRLQTNGLIEYQRGNISVLDRSGLEARVCECYGAVKKEYGRLLPLESLAAVRAQPRSSLRFADGRTIAPFAALQSLAVIPQKRPESAISRL